MDINVSKIENLRQALLKWGKANIRRYPWRWKDDPYSVLVAEFMLHRTQVRQVIPIYENFLQTFPSLSIYAQSDRLQVKQMLVSLGLNWRITAMTMALDELWSRYKKVPAAPELLKEIEGIGQYIAGATCCFTQNKPLGLIDTNTVRVIGRVFGLDLSGEARRRKSVVQAIDNACDPEQPRDYYYALIDLAHSICKPVNPYCESCPLLAVPCEFGRKRITLNLQTNIEK
jgi:A/G-specific adenine glycosylase